MNIDHLVQYGHAKKPFDQLNATELAEVNKRLGKKMIVEEVNGQLIETSEYHG